MMETQGAQDKCETLKRCLGENFQSHSLKNHRTAYICKTQLVFMWNFVQLMCLILILSINKLFGKTILKHQLNVLSFASLFIRYDREAIESLFMQMLN